MKRCRVCGCSADSLSSGFHAFSGGAFVPLAASGASQISFFPAEASGGVALLKAIAPVLQDVKFCPTGGVDARNAEDYLVLPNVFAVGGSWVMPR